MRATLGERFKILLLDAGLTPEDAGKILHVTPRAIRYWISGKVLVPYAAYKLIRIMRLFELPCEGWDGWHMHSGRLWSPEGFSFKPDDANWWYLLVRRAEGFTRQYHRANELERALQQGTDDAAAPTVAASSAGAAVGAATSPTAVGGRAAQPTGPNLLLEHFRKWTGEKGPFSLESALPVFTMKSVANIPHYEIQGKGGRP